VDNDTITASLQELEAIERNSNAEHRPLFDHREAVRIVHMRMAIRVGHVYDEGVPILYGGQAQWQAIAQ